ncbi:MAG: CDP-alcohol phosphatidyltransferase family protein [Deltaproteobacteria bacterium]|nr:CDP-alcohol phosphatidyltransferase family protein [Deltaproteobacteria bacterium]
MPGLAARIKRGFKPREVEEYIDYYYHRPLAGLVVQLLLPLPFTPNQITVASGVVGLAAGVAVGYAGPGPDYWVVVGGCLLLFSILLDCADGQLARLRGIASPAGRILDGFVDFVAPTAVFIGQAFFMVSLGHPLWLVLLVGSLAGGSLLWHAGQFDSAKNLYLHNADPEFNLGGDALLTAEYVEGLRVEYAEKGETFNSLLMWGFGKGWLKAQAKGGSADLGSDAPHAETPSERQLYRTFFRATMRAWTWLGFGTHLFLLTVSAWAGHWGGMGVWVAWGVMAGPMNILCAVLLARRRELEQRYFDALRESRVAKSA